MKNMEETRNESQENYRKEYLRRNYGEELLEKSRKALLEESYVKPIHTSQKNFWKDPKEASEGILNELVYEFLMELTGKSQKELL